MMDERPSYYANIPASVRYDEELTANAKLLYGEITALADKRGYCWASNAYFARLYNVHKNTISLWIGMLKARGHVKVKQTYKPGTKELSERRISINERAITLGGYQ